ncbi:DUF3891 family protein [Flavobacterium sp. SM2513]|uniref:DUF3891 family protein n=1 Tax=Flavobacterium sp. SM2513 TaxID=3424766 RepID=UPI003D7FDFD9
MIVRAHTKGWKVITQRSHGLLSALIAHQYEIDLPNDVLVPILIAIAEHDDGVAETHENKNLTDAGAPRHFLVSASTNATDLKQYINVMETARAKSQLNALMTSMHLDFIFSDRKIGEDKDLDTFLTALAVERKSLVKNLNLNQKKANHLYRFVEWCDAFSLLICMDKIQPEGRSMEVSTSPDGAKSNVFYNEDQSVCVTPWPFKINTFKVFYEYKIVKQLQFASIEEFHTVYKNTPIAREEFTFKK